VKFEDMLIVLLIVLILFGGSKIPQLGAGLGKGLRSFKDAMNGKDEVGATVDGKAQGTVKEEQPKA
jgi:sec-independent protein translocase protein TatA